MAKLAGYVAIVAICGVIAFSAENVHCAGKARCNQGLTKKSSKARKSSAAFLAVQKVIRDGFPDWRMNVPAAYGAFRSTWPSNQTDLLPKLADLTPSGRQTLRVEMLALNPDTSKIPFVFPVLLDPTDDDAWLRLLDETTVSSEPNGDLYFNFMLQTLELVSPAAGGISKEARARMLETIAKRYPKAQKYNRSNFLAFGEKRALDAWLRLLLPNDEIFDFAYGSSPNPMKAYQFYLDTVKSQVISKMDNQLGYGQVKATDVLAFSKVVTDFLREPAVQRYIKDGGFDPKQSRIYLHGSIIKGLGKKGSDLDPLVRDVQEDILDFSPQGDHDFKTLRARLKAVADSNLPQLELDLKSVNAHKYGGTNLNINLLEPFFFECRSKGVNLQVMYPRNADGFYDNDYYKVDCDQDIGCHNYEVYSPNATSAGRR